MTVVFCGVAPQQKIKGGELARVNFDLSISLDFSSASSFVLKQRVNLSRVLGHHRLQVGSPAFECDASSVEHTSTERESSRLPHREVTVPPPPKRRTKQPTSVLDQILSWKGATELSN